MKRTSTPKSTQHIVMTTHQPGANPLTSEFWPRDTGRLFILATGPADAYAKANQRRRLPVMGQELGYEINGRPFTNPRL